MFDKVLEDFVGINFLNKILIKDYSGILLKGDKNFLQKHKESIYVYEDVEKFRYLYETKLKNFKGKCFIVVFEDIYIPYDIQKNFETIELSYDKLFPKLNSFILRTSRGVDYDLLSIAYENLFEPLKLEVQTKAFLEKGIYEEINLQEYCREKKKKLEKLLEENNTYNKWFEISQLKANVRNLEVCNNQALDLGNLEEEITKAFKVFIRNSYKGLSGRNSAAAPVLLNKTMDYLLMKEKKFALIVMDGMSVADWQIISKEFKDIDFEVNNSFALIPTLTAISRQSLFSGRLPVELENPFNLAKEKSLFIEKCKEYGYKQEQIRYHRGYDIDISIKDRCLGIVINDIDDLVHNQLQGYKGMYRDIEHLAKTQQLQGLVKKLYKNDFEVYITSDHGNTRATGVGKVRGAGIEVETKSQRVIIYKEFASREEVKEEYNLIEYPGYYLPKDNKYFICEDGKALTTIGEEVLSHGGISIEEVVVPFIKIKGVKNE